MTELKLVSWNIRAGLGRDFRCWNRRSIAAKVAPTPKTTLSARGGAERLRWSEWE